MFAARSVRLLVPVCVMTFFVGARSPAYGGSILLGLTFPPGDAVFEKGTIHSNGNTTVLSNITGTVKINDITVAPFNIPVRETISNPTGSPFTLVDVAPLDGIFSKPGPPILSFMVDIFFMAAARTGPAIPGAKDVGPLPGGVSLVAASVFGVSGREFTAQITPIDNLANLPNSSDNDIKINWNLFRLSSQTGNFFLVRATVPAAELLVPEPGSLG